MTTSPSVRVKSHFFDLFLTQERIILTQPDYPDAPQVDVVFTTVRGFSRGETDEGDPSLSVTVVAGGNERTMVLVFDGGGGFKPVDERDRVAELVGGMVAEMATPPVASSVPDMRDDDAPSTPNLADSEVPSTPDIADSDIPSPPDLVGSNIQSAPDIADSDIPSPPDPADSDVQSTPDLAGGDVPSPPDLADTEVPPPIKPPEGEKSSLTPPVSASQVSEQKNIPAPKIPPARPSSPVISGLEADHIIVKGHEFTASLTPETISLIRHENPEASPLMVKRRDISDVFRKESAGGDPSLHIRVRSATGDGRTMVLVFSEWYSGGRAPERDEWAAALTESATTAPVASASRPARPSPGKRAIPSTPERSRPMGGAPVYGVAKFCTECGAPLGASTRFCPNCGTPAVSGAESATRSGGIRDLPFDAGVEDEGPAIKGKTKQKREKPERAPRKPRTHKKASFRFRSQEMGLSEVPFFEKLFGFLAAPEDAFRYTKNDRFGQAIIYLAAVLTIFAAATSIILHLFAGTLDAAEYPRMAALGADIVGAALLIPRIVIFCIVFISVWSVVMHILLRIFGQSDDVTETFRTCAYAATPFGTVGLIPFFGPPVAALWMLFLQYKGLVAADDVENRFALVAVAVPVILFVAIFYIFFSAGGSQ